MLHFIETPIFTKQVLKLLDDEAYKEGHLTKVRVSVFGLSIIL
jgi:hypothetical protein